MRYPARALVTAVAALTSVQSSYAATCPPPGVTQGVPPQLLSVCSVLFASITKQLSQNPSGPATARITYTVTTKSATTTNNNNGQGTATTTNNNNGQGTTTSRGSFTTSTTVAITRSSVSTVPTSRTTTATSSSPPGTRTRQTGQGTSASSAAAGGGVNRQQISDQNYRDHVVIPAAVVSSVVGVALIAGLLWFCLARRRRRRRESRSSSGEADLAGEKQTPATTMSSGAYEASPTLPVVATHDTTAMQQPAYFPPPARYSNTNATPRGATPEIPPYPIERSDRSPTPTESTPPWRVQPLRHFRRYSDPPSPAEPSNSESTDSTAPAQAQQQSTQNGLTALQEEDGETPFEDYRTPAENASGSWLDLPRTNNSSGNTNSTRNRGLWSSWVSSSSGVSGPSEDRPAMRDGHPANYSSNSTGGAGGGGGGEGEQYPPRMDSAAIGTAL